MPRPTEARAPSQRGPAVWALRAQTDKAASTPSDAASCCSTTPNLQLREAMVTEKPLECTADGDAVPGLAFGAAAVLPRAGCAEEKRVWWGRSSCIGGREAGPRDLLSSNRLGNSGALLLVRDARAAR